jgi:uncharacterized protein
LQTASALLAGGAAALAADTMILQPNDPQLVQMEIALARLPAAWDGFRIAQLSDFHYDPYFSAVPIRKAVAVVNGLRPDLVVLTGDFVSSPPFGKNARSLKQAAGAIEPCARLLRELHAPLGSLAVLGNHDVATDPERVTNALQAQGIPVLRNRSTSFARGGARLWFAGIDDAIEGAPHLHRTLQGIPGDEFVILLAHEPDFVEQASRFPVDLQLSGHSHGGQVRLPWLGAPILPPLGRLYPMGLYRIGGVTLYTNVGIGTVVLPIRLNCPPEITLLTLRAGSKLGKN